MRIPERSVALVVGTGFVVMAVVTALSTLT
jgi:hypothetical protein